MSIELHKPQMDGFFSDMGDEIIYFKLKVAAGLIALGLVGVYAKKKILES